MSLRINSAIFYPVPRELVRRASGGLWGYIRFRMGEDGGPAVGSRETIAADFQVTERTVELWTRDLEGDGHLVTSQPKTGRTHTVRRWAILPRREHVVDGVGETVLPTKGESDCALPGERAKDSSGKGEAACAGRAQESSPDYNKDGEQRKKGQPAAPRGRRAALEEETDPARRAVALVVGADHFRVYLYDLAIRNTNGYTIEAPDRT